MKTFDKIIIPIALVASGWVLHDLSDLSSRPDSAQNVAAAEAFYEANEYQQSIACDAAFADLTPEQIASIELCSSDTECLDAAMAAGIPEDCAAF